MTNPAAPAGLSSKTSPARGRRTGSREAQSTGAGNNAEVRGCIGPEGIWNRFGLRRARSVLTTYPRHGVMRGNHRLTFAR